MVMHSIIHNAYFSGASKRHVGLSGGIVGSIGSESTIQNCYVTTYEIFPQNTVLWSVISSQKPYPIGVGAIAGMAPQNSITHCYYDQTTTGLTKLVGLMLPFEKNKFQGYKTASMKKQKNYQGWDFTKVWGIDAIVNDGYPFIRGNNYQ